MSEQGPSPTSHLDRVVVLAPFRKDAEFVGMLLRKHLISYEVCRNASALENWLAESPGAIVATHEALDAAARQVIADHLAGQADWSELPILILLDKASPHAQMRSTLAAEWPRSRQVFYQRPVAALELVSGVQSALLARIRQRDVRDHIEREIELRRELNHRVKNMLASVFSIFQMTRRRSTTIEQLVDNFEGRLNALVDVHSAVFRSGGESVSFAEVVDVIFAPYRSDGDERLIASGPPLTITKEAGTTLALCLHELVTNALKYGALSNTAGKVALAWSVTQAPAETLTIEWSETGGPVVVKPARSGYGTGYVRAALTSLTGAAPAFNFRKQGLRFCVTGPLARISADRSET